MIYSSERQPLIEKIQAEDEISTSNYQIFKSLNIFQTCLPKFTKSSPKYCDYDSEDDEEEINYPIQPTIQSGYSASEKLYQLRKSMKEYNIGTYIIPSSDEHISEYTSLSEKRREYISGFTGSAGIAIITLEDASKLSGEALLSTDGRYFLQAEKQLDLRVWKILKQGNIGQPPWNKYIVNQAVKNKFSSTISVDPRLISIEIGDYFRKESLHSNFKFKPEFTNLVDLVWENDTIEKPIRSLDPVYYYDLKYSGKHTNGKLKEIRQKLKDSNSKYYIVSELDSIAWLFNLRSDQDVLFTPVFYAYAIVSEDNVTLYIDKRKLNKEDEELNKYLHSIKNLIIVDYTSFYDDLYKLKLKDNITLPSKAFTNYALYNIIRDKFRLDNILHESIIANIKVFKNETELFNTKIAQYKDSFAYIIFIAWLEDQLINKKKVLNEWDAALKIYKIRSRLPNFKGLSYDTISSTGANASIIHYSPSPEENSIIDPNRIYLIDSGCHFLEGTTDITRTFKFGDSTIPSNYKKYYTLVLKGHISVAMAKFPPNSKNTPFILDSYARQPLWNQGLDFNHGTGHGVGHFGTIHEGPLYIPTQPSVKDLDLFKPGAIVTDEPGYYIDGEVGFRVESELEIIEVEDGGRTKNGAKFLGFNYLTKIPYCKKLIDLNYLSNVEIQWINNYHENIKNEFGDKLLEIGDKRAYDWLINETKPL
ncbi:unnamed protein product [Candida verbasci]|uniref:Creatinase/aminopeptidase n=1 Tax=Candida verbasci TaxID=1227364 RepID=A0A9W4XBB5_9ASCO|nr:unnamed protein product [Candida verbasci]